MADGYQGYNKVKETKRCCCWAHIRRYLLEAIPKGHQKDYSKYLLEHRPNSDMTDEELDSLAPWNETVQQQCSNKTE